MRRPSSGSDQVDAKVLGRYGIFAAILTVVKNSSQNSGGPCIMNQLPLTGNTMQADHYFDDPEEGLARATSHPRFQALAQDDFYYDCSDDFSPFGNDDGADVLAYLEDLYQEGGSDAQVPAFIADLIEGWDFGVPPKLIGADQAAVAAWLAEDHMHEAYLQGVCNAWVATAFGQLKITGKVLTEIRSGALAAIACQVRMNHLARTSHPDWTHADKNLERLALMRQVLEVA